MYTDRHVESTALELAIFLTQGTRLAEKMNQAVATRTLFKRELLPHLCAIYASVAESTTSHGSE